jgi:hydrogenase small subunit
MEDFMALNRREFLKIMGGTTAALAFPGVMIQGCKKALEQAAARTNVIWIEGLSCSGCSVSLLNKLNPDIVTVITEHISLNYQGVVMAGTGSVATRVLEEAVKKQRKDFVLIVEGAIPTKNDLFCTIGEDEATHRGIGVKHWVEELGKNAMAVVSVGTCSAYGGIPAGKSPVFGENQTGAVSVQEILKDKIVLNIPGCPPHPDWMVGTLLHVLLKGMPELDDYNRPKMYYGKTVHEQCERLYYYKRGIFAKEWGDGDGCLYNLGCLGMDSGCDIPKRKWNDGASSCTECGSGCIGCTEKVFPDYGKRGIYQNLHAKEDPDQKTLTGVLSKGVKGGIING